ncbi:MAG: CooT family nickel-binding protein [Desulfovermiculus sp.]|nr:CooT family nickel-binding protein [Desulfovermiculus sp.]
MCEVHVYLQTKDGQEKILESVEHVQTNGSEITARNIFGEQKTIKARFTLFDSSQNTILLEGLE